MVRMKTVSGSTGKITDKFGGAETIRILPITDRLAVAAKIAQDDGKNAVATRLAERRISMLLKNFCEKNKDYDAIDAMAKRFGITEDRVKEMAREGILLQVKESYAPVILEAARVGKHYWLENEMKEAGMRYVEIEVQRDETRKTCVTLTQEEFGLDINDIRVAVENAMLSLMKRGLHDIVKSIAKDLDKQHILLRVANQLLTDSKENGNYEFALSIDNAYGLFGYYQDERLELIKEVCKKRCETGDTRYAIELAFKSRLPDQLKDAIISELKGTSYGQGREFDRYIRDCGTMLGEERIKEIAGQAVTVMLKGTPCDVIAALPIAIKYDLKERAQIARRIVRFYSPNVFGDLSYPLDLALKEGLTDEVKRIRKMMIMRDILYESDKAPGSIEQLMEKSSLSYEDVQDSAKSAVNKMLKDKRYEIAKDIAERYGLDEETRTIEEICKALQP